MKTIATLVLFMFSVLYGTWSVAKIRVHNCTAYPIEVSSNNSHDSVKITSYRKTTVHAGQTKGFSCDTNKCKISTHYGTRTGDFIHAGNKKYPKNKGVTVYLWGTSIEKFSTETPQVTSDKSLVSNEVCYDKE
ncbi:hypothetical protein ACFL17_06450 [Pseudomonadota bacterium]